MLSVIFQRLVFGALPVAILGLSGCSRAPKTPPGPPTYPAGVTISGYAVGGMTEARAGNIVRYNLRPVWKRPFELRHKGRSYHRTYEVLGVSADVPAMLKSAWTQPKVPLVLKFDEATMKASIRRAARAVRVACKGTAMRRQA